MNPPSLFVMSSFMSSIVLSISVSIGVCGVLSFLFVGSSSCVFGVFRSSICL